MRFSKFFLLCSVIAASCTTNVIAEDCSVGLATVINNIFDLPLETIPLQTIELNDIGLESWIYLNVSLAIPKVTGLNDAEPGICSYDPTNELATMSMNFPRLEITSQKYNISGTFTNTIPIYGNGRASFILENLVVKFTGDVGIWDNVTPVVQFTDFKLDLILERWTIVMENLMAGTDFGTLITEVLMMNGPDFFKVLGMNLSGNQAILDAINSIYSPTA